jgi:two-component SAPR family response regulator
MAPVIIEAFGRTGLLNVILTGILMCCLSLYKRRTEKKIIMLLKKQKQNLEAKTFGNFTLLFNNTVIKFTRSKSEELLAYLIYKNGSSVKTKELISVLWGGGGYANSSRYGSSLRNLIVDIKHTLAEQQIQDFFIADYNNFRINPEALQCDYYDFLHGSKEAAREFNGEFMNKYSWAEEAAGFIERKILSGKE